MKVHAVLSVLKPEITKAILKDFAHAIDVVFPKKNDKKDPLHPSNKSTFRKFLLELLAKLQKTPEDEVTTTTAVTQLRF